MFLLSSKILSPLWKKSSESIKAFLIDNGGEFSSNEFVDFRKQGCIQSLLYILPNRMELWREGV